MKYKISNKKRGWSQSLAATLITDNHQPHTQTNVRVP